MTLPKSIHSHLFRHSVSGELLKHPVTTTLPQAAEACGLPLGALARAVVLRDDRGLLMAVLPADHVLDFDALSVQLKRRLEPVPGAMLAGIFEDCERGSCPPLGRAYGLEVIIDSRLREWDSIVLEPGRHDCLLRLTREEFSRLPAPSHWLDFAQPVQNLNPDEEIGGLRAVVNKFTPARGRNGMEEFHDLPAMPGTAHRILRLARDPKADAARLAGIIEQDPALAAQVMRYANSSLYGFAGRISDLKSAIARVLGFDFVVNLAIGFTIGRSLRVPLDGPLGLNAFWRHSVYAARLAEQLTLAMPSDQRPRRGTAYLAGLLQNLGGLALGETFQSEFFLLNRLVASNPHLPLCELERHVFGTTHPQIGGWLMESWGMPPELALAVRHHHDEPYRGPHAEYAQLLLVANRLLKRHGIGDAERDDLPAASLEFLGLKEPLLAPLVEAVLEDHQDLDTLAERLAA